MPVEPYPPIEERRQLPPEQFPFDPLDDGGRPGKSRWWIWLLILLALAAIGYRLYVVQHRPPSALGRGGGRHGNRGFDPSTPIGAIAAHRGDMPVYLEGLGTVTAFNTVTVKPRVDGQLVSVGFGEGQYVNKGDVLAHIDPKPFQVALAQAEGALAQARGNLAKDQAALRDAQANYERDQELFKEKIIAKQQLDTQGATADGARGAIQSDEAAISASQAAIDSAKLNLSWTNITAPISGRIGLRQVDAGNIIHAADVTGLAIIAQLQPISVLFTLPEDQLPKVLDRLRSRSKMRVQAYSRDGRTVLAEGTLLTVDNQIDQTTGTSRLKAIFQNEKSTLFPNQFVNARLWLDTKAGVTIIPTVAIQRGPTGTFVYVVQPDSTIAVRQVKIGMTQGNDVSIEDGIQPGERVVTDGAEKLVEGMKVTVNTIASERSSKAQQ